MIRRLRRLVDLLVRKPAPAPRLEPEKEEIIRRRAQAEERIQFLRGQARILREQAQGERSLDD